MSPSKGEEESSRVFIGRQEKQFLPFQGCQRLGTRQDKRSKEQRKENGRKGNEKKKKEKRKKREIKPNPT